MIPNTGWNSADATAQNFELQLNARGDQGLARENPITLVYAARDEVHNGATVLREVLICSELFIGLCGTGDQSDGNGFAVNSRFLLVCLRLVADVYCQWSFVLCLRVARCVTSAHQE